MILLDTNILIEILKGNQETIKKVQSFDEKLVISSISAMELYYGAIDKAESKKLGKFISLFEISHIDTSISSRSITLIRTYAKSHGLDIPDTLIAATAMVQGCKLFTYNIKDFRFIEGLVLL